jgi:hypothetical protein
MNAAINGPTRPGPVPRQAGAIGLPEELPGRFYGGARLCSLMFCLVLSCLIRTPCWANAPRWEGRQRCWPAAPLPATSLSPLGPACGAGCHPSSPVLLSLSSVGQRGISAQTIQLLVPVTLNYIGALQHLSPLPLVHCQLLPLRHLQLQLTQQRPHSPYASLRSTAASEITEAVSSLNSPSSHCPSSSTPLPQLLLVVHCVEAGVVR